MRVLITGSHGQLGKSLSKELCDSRIEFLALSRSELEIRSVSEVNAALDRFKPNYIVNTAAFTNVDRAESEGFECEDINARGPSVLAEACHRNKITLIQISTDYVFDGNKTTPYNEDDIVNPINNYGKSKALGEFNVEKALKNDYYILRTSWLYSEFGKNFAKTIARKAIESKAVVNVVSDQFGQPTFAGDLSLQIIKIMSQKPEAGIYNATNSGVASWFEFAQCIFEELGEDRDRVQPVSSSEIQSAAARPRYSVLSHKKWDKSGIAPMQDWRESLRRNIGFIGESVKGFKNS
jgi:dTDP-4-dehydrorhamnose reductase